LIECKTEDKQPTMNTANCPECAAEVPVPADVMENELIACPECGTELEIISLNPLKLDLAPEVEEDWGE
jgi:alpha-aminoadipate/glutamate carrier protein LysW